MALRLWGCVEREREGREREGKNLNFTCTCTCTCTCVVQEIYNEASLITTCVHGCETKILIFMVAYLR